ncbi:zinc finger, GRF-type containing protein [Tanacetum coccineum]
MDPRNCFCGAPTLIQTSWTQANPGRRFHSCARTVNPCRYFWWVDPAMCARSTVIIPGLLRNINNLQAEAIENARKARRMKMLLCFIAAVLCDVLGVAADLCDVLGVETDLFVALGVAADHCDDIGLAANLCGPLAAEA